VGVISANGDAEIGRFLADANPFRHVGETPQSIFM
jgi:hypothetical protein